VSGEEQLQLGVLQYEVRPGHTHQLVIDCTDLDGEALEYYACELAEAVAVCSEDRHVDQNNVAHGFSHDADDIRRAYQAAIDQLLFKDLPGEVEELRHKMAIYKRWGGQPPALVVLPTQDGEWHAIVPDREGTPYVYDVRPGVFDDIVPTPEQAGAIPDEQGIGYRRKPRWSSERKLRSLDAKLQ
jgi:hypothetical protein